MSTIGENVFKGTAAYGRFVTLIQFYIIVVVSIILLIIGVYMLFQRQNDLVNTTATITKAECDQYTDNQGKINYNCMLSISYVVDEQSMTGTITTITTIPYYQDRQIDITYHKSDPSKVTIAQIRKIKLGIILIIVAIVLAIIGFYLKYITSTYEMAAVAAGTSSILSTLRF